MPASATAFEALLLQSIWYGALALSLASILAMTILIIRRMIGEQIAKKSTQRKQELLQCFYAAIKSPVDLTSNSLPPVTPADHALIMRIAVD